MRRRRAFGRIYGMKYSWKGHKDRNRHTNRLKRVGKLGWFKSKTQTATSPPLEGEAAGTIVENTSSENGFYLVSFILRTHFLVVGMLRFMSDINQPSLPTPFHSVLVPISVFMALSTEFHSINSPDNSPFSDCLLPVLSLPYWSFHLYFSLWKSPSALI